MSKLSKIFWKYLKSFFIILIIFILPLMYTEKAQAQNPIILNQPVSAVSQWFKVNFLSFAGIPIDRAGQANNPNGPSVQLSMGNPQILNSTDCGYVQIGNDQTLFLRLYRVGWTVSIITTEDRYYIGNVVSTPITAELCKLDRGDFSLTTKFQAFITFPNYNVTPDWEQRIKKRIQGDLTMQIVVDTGSVFGIGGPPKTIVQKNAKGQVTGLWNNARPVSTIKGILTGPVPATRDYLEHGPAALVTLTKVATDSQRTGETVDPSQGDVQSGETGGKGVSGWYIGPKLVLDPETGQYTYVQRIKAGGDLYSPPENTLIPTDDGYGTNMTALASMPNHDPRIYERNLTVVYAHSFNYLSVEGSLFKVTQEYHWEYKRVTRIFAIVVSEDAKTENVQTIVGWEVKNFYIQQDYEAYVLVGSYYDWNPITFTPGKQGKPDANITGDIFDGVPSGTIWAKATEFGLLDLLGYLWWVFVIIVAILAIWMLSKFRRSSQMRREGAAGSGTEALFRGTSKSLIAIIIAVGAFVALWAFTDIVFVWWFYLLIFGGIGGIFALYFYAWSQKNKSQRVASPPQGIPYEKRG